MNKYLTFAKFDSATEAEDLCQFFDKYSIKYVIEREKGILDKILVGETFDHLILLKIKNDDFKRAGELIRTEYTIDLSKVDNEYYLFRFSNDELLSVFNSNDGWNYFDVALSKKLLDQRNITIFKPEGNANSLFSNQVRLANYVLIIEYIVSLSFGFVGIVIGVATLSAKKTSQSGQRIDFYDSWTRKNAIIILLIGIIRSLVLGVKIFL
jgi:hypothetical protein